MATRAWSGRFGAVKVAVCVTFIVAGLSFTAGLAEADPLESAGPSASAGPPEGIPEIVVEGTRPTLEQRIDTFVSGITRQTSAHKSLARWNRPICPLVAGLPDEQTDLVLERISRVAVSAGARLAYGECRVNFYVVVTSEPDELLRTWREHEHHLFGDASRWAIDRFLGTRRPVRVWYNTEHAKVQTWQATRLEVDPVVELSSVIVVVDADRVDEIGLDPLADYVAMTGLVQLDLGAELGSAPTVLRMFADAHNVRPRPMSSWDRAFLEAVYHTPPIRKFQRSHIASRMAGDVAPP